jgi:glycogen debranching enzyme
VFCEAHYDLYHDPEAIEGYISGLIRHLDEAGLDTVSENFWGDAPFYAAGCPAQAWSQAELIRIWRLIHPIN